LRKKRLLYLNFFTFPSLAFKIRFNADHLPTVFYLTIFVSAKPQSCIGPFALTNP
jgi:hypothetical protein